MHILNLFNNKNGPFSKFLKFHASFRLRIRSESFVVKASEHSELESLEKLNFFRENEREKIWDYFIENIFALLFTTFYLNIAPLDIYSYVCICTRTLSPTVKARLIVLRIWSRAFAQVHKQNKSAESVASRGGQFNTDTCARCIHAHTQAPAQWTVSLCVCVLGHIKSLHTLDASIDETQTLKVSSRGSVLQTTSRSRSGCKQAVCLASNPSASVLAHNFFEWPRFMAPFRAASDCLTFAKSCKWNRCFHSTPAVASDIENRQQNSRYVRMYTANCLCAGGCVLGVIFGVA